MARERKHWIDVERNFAVASHVELALYGEEEEWMLATYDAAATLSSES